MKENGLNERHGHQRLVPIWLILKRDQRCAASPCAAVTCSRAALGIVTTRPAPAARDKSEIEIGIVAGIGQRVHQLGHAVIHTGSIGTPIGASVSGEKTVQS